MWAYQQMPGAEQQAQESANEDRVFDAVIVGAGFPNLFAINGLGSP
jgi:hypothetical protein